MTDLRLQGILELNYLRMVKYHTHPALRFAWPSDIQFMMEFSGCVVPRWHMVQCQFLLRSRSKPRIVSQNENSYPQRVTGPYSKIPRALAVIHQ